MNAKRNIVLQLTHRPWALAGAAAVLVTGLGCSGAGDSPGGSGDGTGAGGANGLGGTSSGAGATGLGAGAGGGPVSIPPSAGAQGTLDVGTTPIHRLSNLEYNNTVRDLLGTTLQPASGFQDDGEALGFNTIADAQDMNPLHVKDYFDAATSLTDDVFANAALSALLVTCQPAAAGDVACAQQIIGSFGLRAFRRPLEQWETDHYSALYQAALTAGVDHNGAIQHIVRTMLASPQFLYRMEFDADPFAAAMRPLNSYEIASRLSYMLWSTMPDQALFDAAASNSLLQLDTLQAQVDRMLLDGKSSTLVDSFAWQWFGAFRLTDHSVDTTYYPVWDETLRASMQTEMKLFFDEFVRQNRPYTEILTADVNFVDAKLAEVYGMPAPAAAGFSRVEFAADERKGVLGLAGFLAHTSRHNRTAPTIRAAWVLDALLCQDISPPTNVVIAQLPEVDPTVTSVRELLDAHRNNPACSVCHDLVDPVGLGMEQYDAIGRFRAQYENGDPIDTAGTLPGGVTFTGFADMLDKVSAMPRSAEDPTLKTVQCAAQKLFTYGLGRKITPSEPYVEQLVTNWEGQPLTLGNLIKQLVVNDVFRFRRGSPETL